MFAIWLIAIALYICGRTNAEIEPSPCQKAYGDMMLNRKYWYKLILYSGKEANDLGDYNQCSRDKNLTYGTFRIIQEDEQSTNFIGVCLPSSCTKDDFNFIADVTNYVVNPLGYSIFPYYNQEILPDVTSGNELGIFMFAVILCLTTIGVLIEYSTLFDIDKPSKNLSLEKRKTSTGLFFLAFSITRNMRIVFSDPSAAKGRSLKILEGMKVLSFMWIMLCHGYSTLSFTPISNAIEIHKFVSPWYFAIINGGYYGIDMFFFISAFLGTYLLLIKCSCGIEGKPHDMNIAIVYFHKVYRMIPPMVMFIIFYMTFFKYIGDGPVWAPLANDYVDGCKRDWWTHFLFLSNLLPVNGNKCLSWLWYISCDLQFFIFLPIQVWLYSKKRYAGYGVAILILIANIITSFIISDIYKINVSRFLDANYGFIIFLFTLVVPQIEISNKSIDVDNDKVQHYYSQGISNIFNAIARPLFAVSISMIIIGSLTGHNSFFTFIFGSKGYVPWARIIYMSYIVHLSVFEFYYNQQRQATYLHHKSVCWVILACVFVTFLISVPFSMCFEMPFVQIEKLLMFPEINESTKIIIEEATNRNMTIEKGQNEFNIVGEGSEELKINQTLSNETRTSKYKSESYSSIEGLKNR